MTQTPRLPVRSGLPDQQQIRKLVASTLDEPLTRNAVRVNADYTVQDSDDEILCINTTPITITLPAPATVDGRDYTVVRAGTGTVTIVAADGALLSGAASQSPATQWDTYTLRSLDASGSGGFVYVIL